MNLLVVINIVHILMVVSQAQTEDAFTEATGSGDGDNKKSATSDVSLIDENGDISLLGGLSTVKTAIDANNENVTLVPDTTESEYESIDSLNTTVSEAEVTKDYTSISTTSAPAAESTTESSTESTTVAISSTSSTTTTTDTTTTTVTSIPTTTTSTTDLTTTSVKSTTKEPTTTTSTTTVIQIKRNRTNTKALPVRTTSTTVPNGNAVNRCIFLDAAFQCEEEIVCHGEGEIDCTEDVDSYSSTTAFLEKVSMSSVSDDYLDYEDADYNIGTFPPDLIGGKSRRKEIHSFFKIPSLEDFADDGNFTDAKDDTNFDAEEIKNTTSDEISDSSTFSVTTGIINKEYTSSTDDTTTKGSMIISDSSTNTPFLNNLTSDETSKGSLTELITTETAVGETEIANETNTEDEMLSNNSADTSVLEEDVSDTNTTDDPINIRKRRDTVDSSESDPSPTSFKAEALESPKKTMKMKHCRLSGNLVCSPNPAMLMCKGKTFCQAVSENAKAYEKSTPPDKGLKKWAIAVIAICAVVASFVIVLLIYLVLTSYKKLKIKPENRVTSLNFINNADP